MYKTPLAAWVDLGKIAAEFRQGPDRSKNFNDIPVQLKLASRLERIKDVLKPLVKFAEIPSTEHPSIPVAPGGPVATDCKAPEAGPPESGDDLVTIS